MSDLIRRSDAIKAITDISKNYTGKGKRDYHPHIDFLVDALKYDVPTIEPKRGEWKRRIVDNGFNADWVCSECGYRVKTDFVDYNFCPNCGADMREVRDE